MVNTSIVPVLIPIATGMSSACLAVAGLPRRGGYSSHTSKEKAITGIITNSHIK
jgi:hypothetical protein